jgi:hypothetical protein
MTILTSAQERLQRLMDATPTAWRQDRVFRGAIIGLAITGALLVLRLVGPQAPQLQPPGLLTPAAVPALPTHAGGLSASQPPPFEVPRITPGHSLDDVTVIPMPNNDRFGTFKPGKYP